MWSSTEAHICHSFCFLLFICYYLNKTGGIRIHPNEQDQMDPFSQYGIIGAVLLYIIRFLPLVQLPYCILNFLGLILYNPFPAKVTLKHPISSSPFICFRIPTRGDCPEMVLDFVYKNLSVCRTVGLKKFVIEIVTRAPFPIPENRNIQQILVPEGYTTKSGIMYRCRSLQYCLESGVNKLKDDDWIVHLDEDTLMTEDSLRGILNFCTEGRHPFGQGVLIFADNRLVNWMTTMLNSYRVAEDHGRMRLQHLWFQRPVFSFRGSYLVTRVREAIKVGWDHGYSFSHDTYFAMVTCREGYTSGFIEGEMRELPGLTIWEHILQRKRWFRGTFLAIQSKAIPFRIRAPHYLTFFCWAMTPIYILKRYLESSMPLPHQWLLDFLLSLTGSINIYMFIFGTVKQFSTAFPLLLTVIPSIIGVWYLVLSANLYIETIMICMGIIAIIKNDSRWHVTQKTL